MHERTLRIDALRLTRTQVAALLELSEERLAHWIDGDISTEDADIIEVGISLLEGVRLAPRRYPQLVAALAEAD